MDDGRPGDQPPGAGDATDHPAQGGGHPSGFPTFGQSPGWQDERQDEYGRRRRRTEPAYGNPNPYGQQGWQQAPYQPPSVPFKQAPPYAEQQYGGYGNPYGQHPYAGPQTESGAIIALVLAILSYVMLPLVGAIGALIVASHSKAKILSSDGWYSGLGMVTAAKVLSWINIGLTVGGTILTLLFFLLAGSLLGNV